MGPAGGVVRGREWRASARYEAGVLILTVTTQVVRVGLRARHDGNQSVAPSAVLGWALRRTR